MQDDHVDEQVPAVSVSQKAKSRLPRLCCKGPTRGIPYAARQSRPILLRNVARVAVLQKDRTSSCMESAAYSG